MRHHYFWGLRVDGTSEGGEGGAHSWNEVKVEDTSEDHDKRRRLWYVMEEEDVSEEVRAEGRERRRHD